MASQLEQALAKIAENEAKAEAEKLEVNVRVDELVAEVALLKAQVEAGLDISGVLEGLDRLGTKIETIYVPPAFEPVEPVEPAPEPLDPGVEV